MSHPYSEHRQHHAQHKRVGHLTGASAGNVIPPHVMASAKKRASGGRVDSQRDAIAVTGKPPRQRLDRPMRAKGGRTKHKGTNINIIMGHPGGAPMPPPMAAGPAAPPMAAPAMPPRPPMVPPMAGAAPGMPPGGPIRKAGGRAYATGGAVKSGPAWNAGLKAGTQVQHTNNKGDTANIGRGRVITYRTGGAVEHPANGGMAPHLPSGAGGGKARLAKARMAARG